MWVRRSWGEQVVRSGANIDGKTGFAIMLAGMLLGLVISLLQLTVLAWFASIIFGDNVWWIYYGILAVLAWRFGNQLRRTPGRHREDDRVGRHAKTGV